MTETIQTAMDRLMTISAEPQDYVAEDGLLYCGSCKTPKEAFFPNGKKLFGRDRHPAECRCRQATREKQEKEERAGLHEAACVAVNEHGKLVAEDLWNGFDEDFQDAVKEYFAEKNPVLSKEEQAVPVEEESRTDNSDVPVYYESFSYAAENGEVDLYRISRQLNEECRNAIEEAIADNPPLMEKPMNQKPSLHQMEHYQKFYENGEYVRAVESTTEQNYNMIDGCANNLPKPRIINGRESVLDKLRIRQMAREKQKSSQEQSADMERNRK